MVFRTEGEELPPLEHKVKKFPQTGRRHLRFCPAAAFLTLPGGVKREGGAARLTPLPSRFDQLLAEGQTRSLQRRPVRPKVEVQTAATHFPL